MRFQCSVMLVAAILALSGCATPPSAGEPLTAKLGGAAPEAQLEFWHQLYEQKLASNDDAFHGMLLLIDGKDEAADYAGRVASLQGRGFLPDGFDRPGDQAVTRGTLAVIVAGATGIKGGVAMTLLPRNERYATRELVYAGLFPPGSPNQTLTGGQFVSIVGRLEDYQRRAAK